MMSEWGIHMKKKAIVIVAVALLLVFGIYFFPQRTNIGEAAKIELRSGTTGKSVEITDAEDIARITENVNSLMFVRGGLTAGTGGWSYWLKWYDADGNEMESLVICGENRISGDHFFYTGINGSFDREFLDELLKNARIEE